MATTLSANTWTSSRSLVVTNMVLLALMSWWRKMLIKWEKNLKVELHLTRRMSHTCLLLTESIPFVGSSRSIIWSLFENYKVTLNTIRAPNSHMVCGPASRPTGTFSSGPRSVARATCRPRDLCQTCLWPAPPCVWLWALGRGSVSSVKWSDNKSSYQNFSWYLPERSRARSGTQSDLEEWALLRSQRPCPCR